jgi:hypothetical protein
MQQLLCLIQQLTKNNFTDHLEELTVFLLSQHRLAATSILNAGTDLFHTDDVSITFKYKESAKSKKRNSVESGVDVLCSSVPKSQ